MFRTWVAAALAAFIAVALYFTFSPQSSPEAMTAPVLAIVTFFGMCTLAVAVRNKGSTISSMMHSTIGRAMTAFSPIWNMPARFAGRRWDVVLMRFVGVFVGLSIAAAAIVVGLARYNATAGTGYVTPFQSLTMMTGLIATGIVVFFAYKSTPTDHNAAGRMLIGVSANGNMISSAFDGPSVPAPRMDVGTTAGIRGIHKRTRPVLVSSARDASTRSRT
jgi:hypothetical protein